MLKFETILVVVATWLYYLTIIFGTKLINIGGKGLVILAATLKSSLGSLWTCYLTVFTYFIEKTIVKITVTVTVT